MLIANVLMRQNAGDYPGVRALAASLGVECSIDPTITPKMDGDTSILSLRMAAPQMLQVFTDRSLVGEGFCATPAADRTRRRSTRCRAAPATPPATSLRTATSIRACSFRCPAATCAQQRFDDVWYESPQLHEVRTIRMRDLPTCSSCNLMPSCTRCPGLAYMEGNMRGPSSADCEKSMLRAARRRAASCPRAALVQKGVRL